MESNTDLWLIDLLRESSMVAANWQAKNVIGKKHSAKSNKLLFAQRYHLSIPNRLLGQASHKRTGPY
jgi:hypothetical protein